MRETGKSVEAYSGNNFTDFNYTSSSSDLPCKKHPSSSSGGICAYCLKDRLIKLVCSDCGEQRLSSCSCSEISSFPNSGIVEVGSVGRISFLIENEKTTDGNNDSSSSNNKNINKQLQQSDSQPRKDNSYFEDHAITFKRSSSTCAGVKRSSGFWNIGRLFRKKRGKGNGEFEVKSDMCVSDCMGISRSRSLCSFRGAGLNDMDDGSDFAFSSAKISDVNGGLMLYESDKQFGFNEVEPRKSGSEPRRSGSEPRKSVSEPRRSGSEPRKSVSESRKSISEPRKSLSEPRKSGSEPRKSGFRGGLLEINNNYCVPNRNAFGIKESDFNGLDDSAFIDLKLDLSSDPKTEYSAFRMSDFPVSTSDFGGLIRCGSSLGNLETGSSFVGMKDSDDSDRLFYNGGSCRITVSDKGIKMGSKGQKVWKWIFRHQPGRKSSSKRDEFDILKCG